MHDSHDGTSLPVTKICSTKSTPARYMASILADGLAPSMGGGGAGGGDGGAGGDGGDDGGDGGDGGGEGGDGEAGGEGGSGGEGGGNGELAPKSSPPPPLAAASMSKYEFPDHAQRMSNLFASDRLVPCQSREEGMGGTPHVHVHVGWEVGRHGVGVAHATCRRGSKRRSGHGRSVPRTLP